MASIVTLIARNPSGEIVDVFQFTECARTEWNARLMKRMATRNNPGERLSFKVERRAITPQDRALQFPAF